MHPDLAVVLLTGRYNVSTSVRAMKADPVDFLERPVDDESPLVSASCAADRSRRAKAAPHRT